MQREGILFVVSGPSGVGKGTLRENLMGARNDLIYSISATTRRPRLGEVDGRDYFFIEVEKFLHMIQNDELLEWAKVYNNYYGTPKEFVLNTLKSGQDILLEIDIQGALQVKSSYPDGVFVFILPPSLEELADRLTKRGKDSTEEIRQRLACYNDEIQHVTDYDYVVVNDSISEAVARLNTIVEAERLRVKRIVSGGI